MLPKINAVLLLAAISLVVSACSRSTESTGAPRASMPQTVNVIAEPLRFERASKRIEAVGTSRARLSAELHPATSGEVVAVNFAPGQKVRAGDVLIELDRREEELAVRLAKLHLRDAERLYDRYRRSADSGAVVPALLDEARTAVDTAQVELEQAQIALADRNVEAVFDGFVGGTEVDPGDRVNTDTLITTLDDRSYLLVSFDMPEAYIGELAVGNELMLATWSSRTPAVTGEVVDIGSRIDPVNRTFVARARVRNEDDALRPGMSFRVSVNILGELFAIVAENSVQWGANGAYIWSVVNGEALQIPVRIEQRRDGRVLIAGDLEPGDIIVVEGIQRMRNGIAVSYEQRFADDTARSSDDRAATLK